MQPINTDKALFKTLREDYEKYKAKNIEDEDDKHEVLNFIINASTYYDFQHFMNFCYLHNYKY